MPLTDLKLHFRNVDLLNVKLQLNVNLFNVNLLNVNLLKVNLFIV
jgi:hypothetical protein